MRQSMCGLTVWDVIQLCVLCSMCEYWQPYSHASNRKRKSKLENNGKHKFYISDFGHHIVLTIKCTISTFSKLKLPNDALLCARTNIRVWQWSLCCQFVEELGFKDSGWATSCTRMMPCGWIPFYTFNFQYIFLSWQKNACATSTSSCRNAVNWAWWALRSIVNLTKYYKIKKFWSCICYFAAVFAALVWW